MSIDITADELNETRFYKRRIEFANAAPILLARNYSHGGKEFLPDTASAKWNHGQEIQDIEVTGFVLKKDRTSGQARAGLGYITPSHSSWGRNSSYYTEAPEWLLELFGINATNNEKSN